VDIDFKEHDERIIAALSASSNATIVRVNYRLGNGIHYYPTPIHDVLSAYDWVQHELTRESSNLAGTTRRGRAQRKISRIGVCGQLVGGGLAAMLALTESRMGEHRVVAAALNNPIVDWLFTEISHSNTAASEDHQTRKRNPPSLVAFGHASPVSSTTLLATRSSLFRKPAAYFDPFASPVLFFRSPGADVPRDPKSDPPSDTPDMAAPPMRKRKVHRIFPPTYSTLRIPRIQVTLGTESPLLDQGEELVRLMRRSVIKSVREGRNGFARVEEGYGAEGDLEERTLAEARRVESLLVPGSGVWGAEREEAWRRVVGAVGEWFGDVLGRGETG
jgi:acetyl esterase/lipase